MVNFFSRNRALDLGEADLEDRQATCGTCGGARLARALPVHDRPEVWMVRCADCGIVTADRMPTPAFLERYYRDYYAGPVPNGGPQVTVRAVEKLARHIHRQLSGRAAGGTVRILDFGGGDGSVAVALARRLLHAGAGRAEIRVIDISNTEAGAGDPRIALTLRPEIEDGDAGRYDAVIASASLEHVRRPGQAIGRLLGCLAGPGTFYARTPYHIAMARVARWVGLGFDMGYPAHLHDMGAPFWNRVLETLHLTHRYRLIRSAPSVVSSTFATNFPRTLAAHLMKAPWHVLGTRYALVGGWEATIHPRRPET